MSDRMFYLPGGAGYVLFGDSVLRHMYQHAQTRWFHREAGGQLFSPAPHDTAVMVNHATGPNSKDIRRRHAFIPDAAQATADRQSHFNEHRYAVGLWHTHPEPYPTPSSQDRETAVEFLNAFEGAMSGFLLVILGNAGAPMNMAVWVAQSDWGVNWLRLAEA